jgi:hypothetical protein
MLVDVVLEQFRSCDRQTTDSLRHKRTRSLSRPHFDRLSSLLESHRPALLRTTEGRRALSQMESRARALSAELAASEAASRTENLLTTAREYAASHGRLGAAGAVTASQGYLVRLREVAPELAMVESEEARQLMRTGLQHAIDVRRSGIGVLPPLVTGSMRSPRRNPVKVDLAAKNQQPHPPQARSLGSSASAAAGQLSSGAVPVSPSAALSAAGQGAGAPAQAATKAVGLAGELRKRRDSLSILLGNRPSMDILKDRNIVRELPMAQSIKATKIGLNLKLASRPDAKQLEERGILIAAQEVMKRRKERRDSISMFLEARPSVEDLRRRNIMRESSEVRKHLSGGGSGVALVTPSPPPGIPGVGAPLPRSRQAPKKTPSSSLLTALGNKAVADKLVSPLDPEPPAVPVTEAVEVALHPGSPGEAGEAVRRSPSFSRETEGGRGRSPSADASPAGMRRSPSMDSHMAPAKSMRRSGSSLTNLAAIAAGAVEDPAAVGSRLRGASMSEHAKVECGGFSVVSYHRANAARQGSPKYSAIHAGVTYHFCDPEELASFNSDPTSFLPAFDGLCTYSLAVAGTRVFPDPQTFKIIHGKLHLFSNDGEINCLNAWNEGSEEDLLEMAKANFGSGAAK